MSLDDLLIEILACPEDKGSLLYFKERDVLYNPRLKRVYAINDGIPDMLVDDARTASDAEHDELMAEAAQGGVIETMTRQGVGGGEVDTGDATEEGVAGATEEHASGKGWKSGSES